MLVFKHEALLTFIDRLIHDREFAEWFVAEPEQSLRSYGLAAVDLQDVADVLVRDRGQPAIAGALQPTVQFLLGVVGEARGGDDPELVSRRFARFQVELTSTRERLAAASQPRVRRWWKFW